GRNVMSGGTGPAPRAGSGRAEPWTRLFEPREPLFDRAELRMHALGMLRALERRAQRLGERFGQLCQPVQLRRVVAVEVRARADQQQPDRAVLVLERLADDEAAVLRRVVARRAQVFGPLDVARGEQFESAQPV